MRKLDEGPSDLGEVPDEDAEQSKRTKEHVDLRYGCACRPVCDDLEFLLNDFPALVCAAVTDDDDFRNTHLEFLAGEGSACMAHVMNDVMDVVEMFPNEAVDARIARMKFVCPVQILVSGRWTFDGNVVDEQMSDVRNFRLKDENHVTLHDLDLIRATHWDAGKRDDLQSIL